MYLTEVHWRVKYSYGDRRYLLRTCSAITRQEPVAGIRDVATHLAHPGGIGLRRDARDLDAAGRQLNEKEHGKSRQAATGPDIDGEEVGGGEDVPVGFQRTLSTWSSSPGRFCRCTPATARSTFSGQSPPRRTGALVGGRKAVSFSSGWSIPPLSPFAILQRL